MALPQFRNTKIIFTIEVGNKTQIIKVSIKVRNKFIAYVEKKVFKYIFLEARTIIILNLRTYMHM